MRQREYVEQQSGKSVDVVIQDLGSGMNYKKSGLKRLLLLLLQGRVKELILRHKDRLLSASVLRFGSEIVFQICQHLGVKVTILEEPPDKPPMELLCQDLVEMMTVFCSTIYGHRSNQNKKCSTLLKPTPTAA